LNVKVNAAFSRENNNATRKERVCGAAQSSGAIREHQVSSAGGVIDPGVSF
jgi:hypothetical protein